MAFINKEDISLTVIGIAGYLFAKTHNNFWEGLLIAAGSVMLGNAVFRHLGYEGRKSSFEEK